MRTTLFTLLILLFSFFFSHAQNGSKKQRKQLVASPIEKSEIQLDGRLTENIWKSTEFVSGFTQREPNEGAPASERTEVAFAYSNDALYIGARMYSPKPGQIQSQLARRDNQGNAERLVISLDTYLDRRTSHSFAVSASGVRADYYQPEDEMNFRSRDYSFDPVWTAQTHIDSLGWTAEMRIPFSQLRFSDSKEQVWGLNINRYLPHKNEDVFWVMVPQDETGWASRFGLLTGIEGVVPSRRLEFLPYVAGEAFYRGDPESANPFEKKSSYDARIGGDIKVGLGPNLTLDGTVNPDFGQVEADPAQVNLSAFETFFEEKRPFFTEGQQLFQVLGGGRSENYFYSRRIGAAPSLRPDADFSENISNTSILGAAKIIGRTPEGLSVGALTALTGREKARVFDTQNDRFSEVVVEPLTSYNVVRLQQEFGPDASTAGIIVTGVYRNLKENSDLGELLNRSAITGGGDWNIRFNGGQYQLSGDAGFSYISGTPESIIRNQASSARYYQRPDASYLSVDSSRTSLSGFRGNLELSKNSGEHWLWEIEGSTKSPGFELNDTGILFRSDDISTGVELTYRENDPGSWYQSYRVEFRGGSSWNYGGIRRENEFQIGPRLQLKNFWTLFADVQFSPRTQSDRQTRGGPLMGGPRQLGFFGGVFTNRSANIFGRFFARYQADEFGGWNFGFNPSVEVRTGGRWEFQLQPDFSLRKETRQYITTLPGGRPETFGKRYVFSNIDRSTLSLQTRVNYAFSSDLTLELYAEPFVASGNYYRPGELPKPRSYQLDYYNVLGETSEGAFRVQHENETFEVRDPDFLVKSFRSSLVLRYQWQPGSTFFLVWQQNRSEDLEQDRFVKPGDLVNALGETGNNLFALKFTYWFPVD